MNRLLQQWSPNKRDAPHPGAVRTWHESVRHSSPRSHYATQFRWCCIPRAEENGVTKFAPGAPVLEPLWHEAVKAIASEVFSAGPADNYVRDAEAQLVAVKAQLQSDFDAQYQLPDTPGDLRDQVTEYLESNRVEPWEEGVNAVVEGKFRSNERW